MEKARDHQFAEVTKKICSGFRKERLTCFMETTMPHVNGSRVLLQLKDIFNTVKQKTQ